MRSPRASRPLLEFDRLRVAASLLGLVILLAACGGGRAPVAVLNVDPAKVELGFSESQSLRLAWEMREPLEGVSGGLRVFVHVLDGPGDVLRTFDHDFPSAWQPGSTLDYEIDLHQSVLGPPLAAGDYRIAVGLYDGSGRRWPLSTAGEPVREFEYALAQLVAVDRASTPMFRFSEQWKPIEPGTDQQVLGRRWLASAGSIVIAETQGEGAVWMSLLVPSAEAGERRLVLDPNSHETRVLIRSDCGGSTIELTGVGSHQLEIPVVFPMPEEDVEEGAKERADECSIHIEPNFHLLTVGTTDQRSVLLEMLGWKPGA
jgi:hypothetical protein